MLQSKHKQHSDFNRIILSNCFATRLMNFHFVENKILTWWPSACPGSTETFLWRWAVTVKGRFYFQALKKQWQWHVELGTFAYFNWGYLYEGNFHRFFHESLSIISVTDWSSKWYKTISTWMQLRWRPSNAGIQVWDHISVQSFSVYFNFNLKKVKFTVMR